MIRELKRLHERMNISTTLSVTPRDTSHGDTSQDDARPSRGGTETDTEAIPPYTETELSEHDVSCIEGWVENSTLQGIDDRHVLANLDEILLILVCIRGQATGKELSTDLRRVFGTDLSSGTVYPRLTALDEEELLTIRELPRRKVYSLQDDAAVCDRVESDIEQTLTFSLTLQTLAVECIDERHPQTNTNSNHE